MHTLTDQVRSELTGAGKAAATNLLSAKAGNLADVIHERTSGLQGRAEAQDEEQEEEEEQDEEQDEENGEEPRGSPRASPGSPGRKPGRRPPGTRGAASPGSRARNSPASGRPPPHRAARAAAAAAARGRGGGTMAEDEATGRGSRGTGTKAKADEQVSGTQRLKEELEHYVEARLQVLLEGVGDRLGAGARRLGEAHVSPRGLTHAVARGGKKLGAHLPSGVGALTSTASHAKETASHAKDTVVGKASRPPGRGPGRGTTRIRAPATTRTRTPATTRTRTRTRTPATTRASGATRRAWARGSPSSRTSTWACPCARRTGSGRSSRSSTGSPRAWSASSRRTTSRPGGT
ncbi:hypothetical protein WKI71_16210 [Streptomyces sp. MS1.AVA.1]|uniref:Uncharacterized protein n=1 Tax=Streptomyces machairae TaxID=3134109 RepID=A0ABU8UM59_9ACTN